MSHRTHRGKVYDGHPGRRAARRRTERRARWAQFTRRAAAVTAVLTLITGSVATLYQFVYGQG